MCNLIFRIYHVAHAYQANTRLSRAISGRNKGGRAVKVIQKLRNREQLIARPRPLCKTKRLSIGTFAAARDISDDHRSRYHAVKKRRIPRAYPARSCLPRYHTDNRMWPVVTATNGGYLSLTFKNTNAHFQRAPPLIGAKLAALSLARICVNVSLDVCYVVIWKRRRDGVRRCTCEINSSFPLSRNTTFFPIISARRKILSSCVKRARDKTCIIKKKLEFVSNDRDSVDAATERHNLHGPQ